MERRDAFQILFPKKETPMKHADIESILQQIDSEAVSEALFWLVVFGAWMAFVFLVLN